MNKPLRVLVIAESDDLARRARDELRQSGYEPLIERAGRIDALRASLAAGRWQVVLVDHVPPAIDGLAAMREIGVVAPDVTALVLVSDAAESEALNAARAGAGNCVPKHDLAWLGPIVKREIQEVEDRKVRRMAEAELAKTYDELNEAQQNLIQSEKLAALGRFSSGLAHELKNPLGIIIGGIELLEVKLGEADGDVKTALGKVKEAASRTGVIVDSMLTFARPSEIRVEPTDPNELVQDAVGLFRYGLRSRAISIRTLDSDERLQVKVDRNQMQQVIFNLLGNAVDASRAGSSVEVRVRRERGAPPRCAIEVEDRGTGIAPDHMRRIFEPFFTTKRDTRGTGLGLVVARSIVERHGGSIEIKSEVDRGTCVRVVLPLAAEAPGGQT